MNKNKKVGIVIPVRNEQKKIVETIESILLYTKTQVYFVIVDDASDDNTISVAKTLFEKHSIKGVIVENETQKGAGAVRNDGITHLPSVDYVLFFDADDRMCPESLDILVARAEQTGADVVLGKYQYLSGDSGDICGMVKDDELHWENILKGKSTASFNISKYGEFLETVNYPWNKLLRFDFIKNINLRFSCTPVHNDIFAHWLILMSSAKITLVDYLVCEHRVYKNRAQITNISDERRLALFNALSDVEALFKSNPLWRKNYYRSFLNFKLNLGKWAYRRLENDYKDTFMKSFRKSLSGFDMKTFFDTAYYLPKLAVDLAFIKYGVKNL